MVFKRRRKQTGLEHLREMIWPSMGWRRTFLYYRLRLMRLQDDPNRIARGMAIGVGVSFTPLPGTHIIQALVFAWLLRANITVTFISTFVGNPWTFPPMWYLAYRVGVGIFHNLDWRVAELPRHFSFDDLWMMIKTDPVHLLVPWMVGGYLCAVITGTVTFFLMRPVVVASQNKHNERRRKRQQRYLARQAAA